MATAQQKGGKTSSTGQILTSIPMWVLGIVFIVTTLIFFRENIFGKGYLWDDVAEYIYPFTTYSARLTAEGQIPFWNPYTFSGMPFAADFQTQYWYPFHTMAFLFLDNQGNLSPKFVESIVFLHVLLAQWTMYMLCRYKGISGMGSVLAAVAFSFSGSLAVRTIHPMVVYHMAWFPLFLMLIDKAAFQKNIKSLFGAALVLGLMLISGHPQTSAFCLIFTVIYLLWMGIGALKAKELSVAGFGTGAATAIGTIVLAAMMVAIQFLPAKELADLSERSEITYEKTADGSLMPSQLLTAIVPNLYGKSFLGKSDPPYYLQDAEGKPAETHYYWDTSFYFGSVTLILGLFGVLTLWNTRFGSFIITMCGIAFLYGLGKNGFLHPLLQDIPVLGSFRNPARMMFYWSFGLSIMAGFGFDALRNADKSAVIKRFLIPAGVILAIALLVSIGALNGMLGTPENAVDAVSGFGMQALVMIIAAFIIGHIVHRGWVNPVVGGAIATVLIFIDLTISYSGFSASKENPAQQFALDEQTKQSFAIKPPQEIFRVSMRNKYGMAMKRNQGPLDNIMLFEGYNPILLSRRSPMAQTSKEAADLLNIRYELVIDSMRGQLAFAERPSVLPRARMVYDVKIVPTDNVKSVMKAGGIDYKHQSVIEEQLPEKLSGKSADSVKHSIVCTSYTDNEFSYTIETEEPGLLSLSEIWYPAWKATIDGNETPMYRTNYSLRGVYVPKGKHTITMKYDSASFATGKMLTIIGLVLCGGGFVVTMVMDKKKKS